MKDKESVIDTLLVEYKLKKFNLLDILTDIKREFKTISPELILLLSKKLKIPAIKIEEVLTFYSFLGTENTGKYTIRVCKTISCIIANKSEILNVIEIETNTKLNSTSEDNLFTIKECNCLGMCDQGPAILINNILLSSIKSYDIPVIITSCKNGNFNDKYGHRYVSNIHKKSELYNFLESKSNFNYLILSAEEIIKKITESGLRGRGGAGFPTGLKWETTKKIKSDIKYIICNADEGEPGTFKDRFLLDKYPDKVIDGLLAGAKAIGATEAVIYLRAEYTYLLEKLQKAIDEYDFNISIHLGSGSYVCGEETALIESLEGHRGEARIKPPYPTEYGFRGKPTVVNNVETLVDVSLILEHGVSFFNSVGTDKSKGTKFFSISGDLEKPGIYELPFGITIHELLNELNVIDVQSVQMGGASGLNIAPKDFKNVIAYEAVPSGGSIIIFNKYRDMLKVAQNFMEFFVEESCGQCVPCREGSIKILDGINQIIRGNGSKFYLAKLILLANNIMISSKCGLGQVCGNSFISIIENNRQEIESRCKE
ncbi:MAG: NAD(P)H-dependent oxidoreductase subunit E [Spirochaetaceae bacterium]